MLIFSKIFLLCGNSTGTFICQRSLLRLPSKPIAFFSPIYSFQPYIPIEVSQVFPHTP